MQQLEVSVCVCVCVCVCVYRCDKYAENCCVQGATLHVPVNGSKAEDGYRGPRYTYRLMAAKSKMGAGGHVTRTG